MVKKRTGSLSLRIVKVTDPLVRPVRGLAPGKVRPMAFLQCQTSSLRLPSPLKRSRMCSSFYLFVIINVFLSAS